MNRAAAEMLGFDVAEMVGRNVYELILHERGDDLAYIAKGWSSYQSLQIGVLGIGR